MPILKKVASVSSVDRQDLCKVIVDLSMPSTNPTVYIWNELVCLSSLLTLVPSILPSSPSHAFLLFVDSRFPLKIVASCPFKRPSGSVSENVYWYHTRLTVCCVLGYCSIGATDAHSRKFIYRCQFFLCPMYLQSF